MVTTIPWYHRYNNTMLVTSINPSSTYLWYLALNLYWLHSWLYPITVLMFPLPFGFTLHHTRTGFRTLLLPYTPALTSISTLSYQSSPMSYAFKLFIFLWMSEFNNTKIFSFFLPFPHSSWKYRIFACMHSLANYDVVAFFATILWGSFALSFFIDLINWLLKIAFWLFHWLLSPKLHLNLCASTSQISRWLGWSLCKSVLDIIAFTVACHISNKLLWSNSRIQIVYASFLCLKWWVVTIWLKIYAKYESIKRHMWSSFAF